LLRKRKKRQIPASFRPRPQAVRTLCPQKTAAAAGFFPAGSGCAV